MQGKTGEVWANAIYIEKEGVAAGAQLMPSVEKWFNMPLSVPHMSLALAAGHGAKVLGPMVKRCEQAQDWEKTQLKDVMWSNSQEAYKIRISTHDSVKWEHETLARNHGGEYDDGEGAGEIIKGVPQTIWAEGATDVGRMQTEPVVLEMTKGNYIPAGL